MTLEDCHSILDLRALARRRLPGPVFNYLDGGAETEFTLRRNTAAFDDRQLIPRYLVDVSSVSTATRILGRNIDWPVFCAPTGASCVYHPEGELAVARAAAKAGTYYSLSVAGTHSIEAVAASSTGPLMLQALLFKDRGLTRELLDKCKAARYQALCLTVDAAIRGKRERELRSGIPARPTLATRARILLHPRWWVGQMRNGPLRMPNLAARSGQSGFLASAQYLERQLDVSATWEDVRKLVQLWNGPFLLKGIMSVEDALKAVAVGATAILVSNHGGRQVDGVPAPIEVLPQIAAAVGDRIEVLLDGGIRRGTHLLKALALGAKACAIGRPYLYGLSAGGEAGVKKALDLLRAELIAAMRFCGCTDVRRIGESVVRPL
jgi:L-lactate dehydrogenase (cytochrome)